MSSSPSEPKEPLMEKDTGDLTNPVQKVLDDNKRTEAAEKKRKLHQNHMALDRLYQEEYRIPSFFNNYQVSHDAYSWRGRDFPSYKEPMETSKPVEDMTKEEKEPNGELPTYDEATRFSTNSHKGSKQESDMMRVLGCENNVEEGAQPTNKPKQWKKKVGY